MTFNVLDNEPKKGRWSAGQRRNRRKTMLHKDIISSLSFCQAKLFKKPDISILFGVENINQEEKNMGKKNAGIKKFEGFSLPDTAEVPVAIIDDIKYFSHAEIVLYLLIIRYTSSCWIESVIFTTQKLCELTGLEEKEIVPALKSLQKVRIISFQLDDDIVKIKYNLMPSFDNE